MKNLFKNLLNKESLANAASGKSVNQHIQKFMEQYIENQNKEDTLLEQYGTFWFYVFIIAGTLLLVGGGWSDGMVLFGWFYDLTFSDWKSLAVAVFGSSLIQIMIGSSIFLVVYNLMAGNHQKDGFGFMLSLCILLFICGLGSSLYLSKYSENIAATVATPPDLTDISFLDQFHKSEMQQLVADQQKENEQLTANQNELIAAFEKELDAFDVGVMQKIKVYQSVNDQASVNYLKNSSVKKRKKYLDKISAAKKDKIATISPLLAAQKTERKALARKLSNALSLAVKENRDIEEAHTQKIIARGNFIKYVNFAINLLRAVLCIMFSLFVFYVLKEKGLTPTNNNPSRKKRSLWKFYLNNPAPSNLLPGLEIQGVTAEWQDDGKSILIKEIIDLSAAKQAMRNSYARRMTSSEEATRIEHQLKFEALEKYFIEQGIAFAKTSDKGLTFDQKAIERISA